MERRLTAICAADMVGYSRLMEADEAGTLQRLKTYRGELIDPAIAQHGGRIIKTTGDGFLCEFPSVVDAVNCAFFVQLEMSVREAGIPEDTRIRFRVGVNLGDVIVEGDDLYGDGVNIAARLEQIADPGGICLSGHAYDTIRSSTDIEFQSLGEVQVKNIERPIRVYKVLVVSDKASPPVATTGAGAGRHMRTFVLAGLAAIVAIAAVSSGVWFWRLPVSDPARLGTAEMDLPDRPSIAVLPFANFSNDEEQEYFVDGMTDDLITRLANVSGLFVIARNSVFTYKGKNTKIQDVAKDLGVRYVLEGSVRRTDQKIRINVQLIDAATGGHVWAETFDRNYTDVFALQDQMTSKITDTLKVVLSVPEQKAIAAHGTRNVEAFDAFLRGMQYLSDRKALDHDGNARAVEQFERALELDPNYAQALAGIAWAKWLYHSTINVFEPNYKSDAFNYAERSLELGDNAMAHRTLSRKHYSASLHIGTSREPHLAIAELETALSLEPNNPDLLADLADVLPFTGQSEKALSTIKRAIRINPDYPKWYLRPLGIGQLLQGDASGSVISLQKWLKNERVMGEYNLWLSSALALSGRPEEARELLGDILRDANTPKTEYALLRKWPLSEADAEVLLEGLRQAGFQEENPGKPLRQ